jgi:hypothetical protein
MPAVQWVQLNTSYKVEQQFTYLHTIKTGDSMAKISLTFSTGFLCLPRIQCLKHAYHLITE